MADRYGRRLPLMIDLVFYSIVEVLSGLAPNYTTFLVLRALFGIGMGGEWGVGASLAMEKVPVRLRGVLSGFMQQGYATGNLLAAVCYFFLFPRFGWRPLFFVGGLPALLALFVRFRVQESEVWQKTRHESWSHLGRATRVALEAVPLSGVLHDGDEPGGAWQPGHVPDVPGAAVGIRSEDALHHHGDLDGGGDHWRHALRLAVRPDRTAPRHHHRAGWARW